MTNATELSLLVALQLAVHISTCLALLFYVIALGLRPDKQTTKPTFYAFWACVLFLGYQIVLWGMMLSVNVQSLIRLSSSGYEFVWRFMWSPQLGVIVLWFFFAHVVHSCPQIKLTVPRPIAVANFRSKSMSRSFLAGVLGIIIADSIFPLASLNTHAVVVSILALSVSATAVELIIKRYRHRRLSLISPTVSWLYGVWVGAWVIAAL